VRNQKFDDHEKDEFLEDSYEYIARYFDGSLQELSERNLHIKVRFKRLSETSFASYIYDNGERVAQCAIWYGQSHFGSQGIVYSNSVEVGHSYNESLRVIDDGYTLQLESQGFHRGMHNYDNALSKQGAAEYLWSILVSPLQE